MRKVRLTLFLTLLSVSAFAKGPSAARLFRQFNPCPSTGKTSGRCPGYVLHHIQALKLGGKDTPSNLQWLGKAEAKVQDRWDNTNIRFARSGK